MDGDYYVLRQVGALNICVWLEYLHTSCFLNEPAKGKSSVAYNILFSPVALFFALSIVNWGQSISHYFGRTVENSIF